jgi:hypothetical protein
MAAAHTSPSTTTTASVVGNSNCSRNRDASLSATKRSIRSFSVSPEATSSAGRPSISTGRSTPSRSSTVGATSTSVRKPDRCVDAERR